MRTARTFGLCSHTVHRKPLCTTISCTVYAQQVAINNETPTVFISMGHPIRGLDSQGLCSASGKRVQGVRALTRGLRTVCCGGQILRVSIGRRILLGLSIVLPIVLTILVSVASRASDTRQCDCHPSHPLCLAQLRVADDALVSSINSRVEGMDLPPLTRCFQMDVYEALYVNHPEPCITLAYSPKGAFEKSMHTHTRAHLRHAGGTATLTCVRLCATPQATHWQRE